MASQTVPTSPNYSNDRGAEVDQTTPWYVIAGLMVVVVLAYFDSIFMGERCLFDVWNSAQYSHGFLIPFFTIALLWMRREPFEPVSASARWGGVGIIVAGLAMRLLGARFSYITVDYLSLIPVIFGVFVIAGGWSVLRWAGPPLAFLVFMLPLPTFVEFKLLAPLQSIAAQMSNFTLQTMGMESYLDGNHITLDGHIPLNVAEACSGLRMSTIFLAMAVGLCMIIERPVWQKALIVMSSVPIALLSNMIRIVMTALMLKILGPDSEFATQTFHDWAGWIMMPIAMGFLYVEMILLDNLVIEEAQESRPAAVGFGGGSATTTPRSPVAARR